MAGKMEKPHMVVGVDLGMTCTGVSYVNLSIGSSLVRWVQKWPGRYQANENKVPTVIVYPAPHSFLPGISPNASPVPIQPASDNQNPSSWGFLSDAPSECNGGDKDYKEWFKTMLDPEKLRQKQIEDPGGAPKSMQEVEKWFVDYLRKMYDYLSFKLGSELSGCTWETARIEFIFSVPTTWPAYPTVERFKQLVLLAGFSTHPTHTLTIGLTEAEAAAVHVSTEAPGIFRSGDVLLVCDAGGGTTDLSVLCVQSTINQAISLQQLDVVFGETIGSAAIDYGFENLCLKRLQEMKQNGAIALGEDELEDAAWEMMKSRDWQSVKCEFGAADDAPLFSISIPGIPYTYSYTDNNAPEIRVRNGDMVFRKEVLQFLFDAQISKLCRLIDTQLRSLHHKFPGQQVAHLVLSGGLGNSAYVQSRLRSHYQSSTLPNASQMRVRVAPDPQLAVCKGLVTDRIRKLLTTHSVLGWRCCRASYGTMCKILYDKRNPEHQNKQLERDPLNGKLYIMQAIAWFIKKGEPVSVDEPIVHDFVRKIEPGDPRKAFPTCVVESHVEAGRLPDQMNHETHILCEIQSDLGGADEKKFIEKNKRFWNLKKHYLRVEYQVKVLIGPADIRFELWFDNQKLSKNQSIKVEWTPVPAPDMAIYDRVELPGSRPAYLANGLAARGPYGEQNGIEDTGNANATADGAGNGKKRGFEKMREGLVSMARNANWPIQGGGQPNQPAS